MIETHFSQATTRQRWIRRMNWLQFVFIVRQFSNNAMIMASLTYWCHHNSQFLFDSSSHLLIEFNQSQSSLKSLQMGITCAADASIFWSNSQSLTENLFHFFCFLVVGECEHLAIIILIIIDDIFIDCRPG